MRSKVAANSQPWLAGCRSIDGIERSASLRYRVRLRPRELLLERRQGLWHQLDRERGRVADVPFLKHNPAMRFVVQLSWGGGDTDNQDFPEGSWDPVDREKSPVKLTKLYSRNINAGEAQADSINKKFRAAPGLPVRGSLRLQRNGRFPPLTHFPLTNNSRMISGLPV